ncbi:MAG: RecQ family ATP-dependent DNA helicase [Bacteroidales bacterium]|nr:RecQ family ATP-dependent DNA helicase [Bacteroidales bacterium]
MIYQLLEKYWGYKKFRPLQEKIIRSVLEGKDTLALMPTGGGKSLTYQIPALAMNGLCLVITPLIALMKDQVDDLKKRDIKATMIYSGMTFEEIDINLTNCIFGDYKFLYLSPERLTTDLFRAKVLQMNICLIAVDEAHCISQWGYDFRPSYLQISQLREILPGIPVLAVTATATPEVAEDIQKKLKFTSNNLFSMSFERPNLSYIVRQTEDKLSYVLKIHRKAAGSGLIYVRSRKKTREIAQFLQQQGINADFYHAGLSDELRTEKQTNWSTGKTGVMVATNAFGMGIDKADVRYVVHLDLPDSPEAYFQEAGRAGRDLKPAWAVLLYHPSDKATLHRRITSQFPDLAYIRKVYGALSSFLQVPYGGGKDIPLNFNLKSFCMAYKLDSLMVYNALKIIEREGYLQLTEDTYSTAKVLFIVNRDDLYRFQVMNAGFDSFIKLLLRSYTGLFSEYTSIYEQELSARAKVPVETVYEYLNRLDALHIIRYIPLRNMPVITYLVPRVEDAFVMISKDNLKIRKEHFSLRIDAMLAYATEPICRSRSLLRYFGQSGAPLCGHCDVCMKKTESGLSYFEMESIQEAIADIIRKNPARSGDIVQKLNYPEEKILSTLRWMIDQEKLRLSESGELEII